MDVINQNLRGYSGEFVSFSDTDLNLLANSQQVSVARIEVYRVTAERRDRKPDMLRGLAIGGGVGFGLVANFMRRA